MMNVFLSILDNPRIVIKEEGGRKGNATYRDNKKIWSLLCGSMH